MPITLNIANPTLEFRGGSPGVRYEVGKLRREAVPLEAHAEVAQGEARPDPLAILAEQNRSRVPELVPIRYGRMSRSPFTFLRGAAAVMASDLSAAPSTDLWVELCGDAHLGNFRWYNAPDRRLVFDINDFDETLPGPFEWDVKRLVASVMVVSRGNGFAVEKCRAAARAAARSYRQAIVVTSELSPLDLHYHRFDSDAVLGMIESQGKKHREWREKSIEKARGKDSMKALRQLTQRVDGQRVIVPDPPLIMPVEEHLAATESEQMAEFLRLYRETLPLNRRILLDRFKLVDVAKKVVGVGSVGTRCMIMLLEASDGTPLFLQFKQAVASVLEPYLGASVFEQAGQRVAEGQKLIQAASDVLLGWARWQDGDAPSVDFYFRQLWDGKGKIKAEGMRPKRLAGFSGLCGKALAFAHARSGDAMMIRGYIGEDDTFDECLVEFAERYAERTESDHAVLDQAIQDGAIEAVRDL